MKGQKERPYVICHMLSALDGKISGEYFREAALVPVRKAMEKIRKKYNCDATLYGAVTAAEVCADGYRTELEQSKQHYAREDTIVVSDTDKFVVAVDIEGRLKWNSGYVERIGRPRAHVIEILTENISDDYLFHLHQAEVSYIFAGKEQFDIVLALQKLKDLFGIQTLMISGGGVINWSFLQAGCIDELSLVLCPLADGRTDTAALFDRSDYQKENKTIAFSLLDVQKLDGGGIWLKYKPNDIR